MTGQPTIVGTGLAVRSLTVTYGDRRVVDEIAFELAAGAWLAIIGPNGAGKSTLLKAIVGVTPFLGAVDTGRGADRKARARTIGYVPQQPALPPGMTTAEYVLLGRTAHLGWLEAESLADRQRVGEVLERLDLATMAGRPVDELSGGESQRATLARALVQEASILVLDEPTSALDLAHQIGVLELVDELRLERDLAVITAMHDLTIASRFADRLLLMADGRAVAEGAAVDVLTEETLSRYYETPVSVIDGPDGGTIVVPLRTSTTSTRTHQHQPHPGDQYE